MTNEFVITETKELENYIRGKVAEGRGSRAEERASCYFGHSVTLERNVLAGRLSPEAAARLRHISAWCTAEHVSEIVSRHKSYRAELDKLFAEYRQKVAGYCHVNNN